MRRIGWKIPDPHFTPRDMYSGFQKGMSILSIIRFDIIEETLNIYYNPYVKT